MVQFFSKNGTKFLPHPLQETWVVLFFSKLIMSCVETTKLNDEKNVLE